MKIMIDEVFVPIQGYENYEISNFGRVLNTDTNRDLLSTPCSSGKLKVTLSKKNVRRVFLVHRLVAQAFFLNYREDRAVDHVNSNYEDNTVLNLTLSHKGCRTRKS